MRRLIPALLLFLLSLNATAGNAAPRRSSKSIKQEQTSARKKINKTRKQIKTNIEDTRRELNRLNLLEGQIEDQNSRIDALRHSADSIKTVSDAIADSVAATQRRVAALEASYADALRAIRRQRQTSSAAAFIFSSRSFDEALRRVRYLRELGEWQSGKARELGRAALVLKESKERLDSAHTRLQATLSTLENERALMLRNRAQAADLVKSLRQQGSNLNKVLSQQQEQARRLDQELNRIIEEEARIAAEEEARRKRLAQEAARKAREEARRKADSIEQAERQKQQTGPETDGNKKTPTEKPPKQSESDKNSSGNKKDNKTKKKNDAARQPDIQPDPVPDLSGAFEQNKGRLPIPVDSRSTVTGKFGRFTHAELSKVQLVNNGMDFETIPGASARAVFPGVVSMIIVMDGYHNVVLLRHGEYLTVYAGIDVLDVHKGQSVTAGQKLGRLFSDPNDNMRTKLHFEIRHEKEKLNPADWLK
ncbi:MAG: peptidoglycan DD-metalloendopeptidase family protein [Muribaculaceae bacterium]|nr:peptidoglycan DD-metalloendopeptidase family protein [Muribaculaceae bacterium]